MIGHSRLLDLANITLRIERILKITKISVSRARRATVEEKKDKRKGRFLAFFLHIVLLALAIWPFLVELPEEKTAEVQIVMIDFRDPPPPIQQTSGSSREGASAPAKSGVESQPEPIPQPVEEVTPPTREPEPQQEPEPTPVEPEPIPEPKPEPIVVPPTPKPELTTKRPEPIKIPPPPPPKPPAPSPEPKPPTPAPVPQQPKQEQASEPEPEKRKPISERISDLFKDTKYSGKDDKGTGSGSKPDGTDGKDGEADAGSTGTGKTGDGDSDSGNRANGSGDGWVGLGSLSRVRISSPPISDLVKEVGRVVVKVCINKRGAVVYVEYDEENSTLKDIGHKQRAVEHVQQIVFERNDNAPDKECGRLTFRMTRNGFDEG